MKYTEALKKREQMLKKLEKDIQDLERIKERLREEIFVRIGKKRVENQSSKEEYRTVGIDSARGIKRYIPSNFYAYVCISFREKIENYLQEVDFDMIGFVEEEVELADRILEGLSMGAEILLAQREIRNVDFVFMDGSVSTFIIKINSAATAAKKSEGKRSNKLKCFYEKIISAFLEILLSKKVVFVPKSTQKNDLKNHILSKLSPSLRSELENKVKSISDLKLAQIILNPLEYIKISTTPHPYNLHNPYKENTEEYSRFSEITEKLFRLANNPEVFYFKGIGGYTYRLESFVQNLPMNLIAQYTFGKTFYLTTEADRKAKDYVKTLLKESFPLEEEIR